MDAVGRLSRTQLAEQLASADAILFGLFEIIWKGASDFQTQAAATADELNSTKFAEDARFVAVYGSTADFFDGLEPHLGPPQNPILEAMQEEHTVPRDTTVPFTTSNGFEGATSATEWEYVVAPKADSFYGCRNEFLNTRDPLLRERNMRKIIDLDDYRAKMQSVNAQLVAGQHVPLRDADLIGGRLYTGPMYEKFNAILRCRGEFVCVLGGGAGPPWWRGGSRGRRSSTEKNNS